MSVDSAAQTVWRYPKNATTQYESRYIEEEEQKKILESSEMKEFVIDSLPKY
jgi:hypothetical protein